MLDKNKLEKLEKNYLRLRDLSHIISKIMGIIIILLVIATLIIRIFDHRFNTILILVGIDIGVFIIHIITINLIVNKMVYNSALYKKRDMKSLMAIFNRFGVSEACIFEIQKLISQCRIPEIRARGLLSIAEFYFDLENYNGSYQALQQIDQKILDKNTNLKLEYYTSLICIYSEIGDRISLEKVYQDSLPYVSAMDKFYIPYLNCFSGFIYYYKGIGRYDIACEYVTIVIENCTHMGDAISSPLGIVTMGMFNLFAGECFYKIGDYQKASQHINSTISQLQSIPSRYNKALDLQQKIAEKLNENR